MAVGVVVTFEIVDIHQDERHLLIFFRRVEQALL